MSASPKLPAPDTVAAAPPWIADTTPDPYPPNMDSESAPPRETGSMPCAEPHIPAPRPLPLSDSHGWRPARPLRAPLEKRKRIERAVVAPAFRPKRQIALSVRAVAAFALGAAVTTTAGHLLESGMTTVLAATCAVVVLLWILVCIEWR